MDFEKIERAADAIKNCRRACVFTGAGISVASGIPDFRSTGGLFERYNPEEYFYIEEFYRNPAKVWKMLDELYDISLEAKPNAAHIAIAQIEQVKSVITQNIDNLHQLAGSKNVIEIHGSCARLKCLRCGKEYGIEQRPKCVCGAYLKPDVVFYGEMIPELSRAQQEAEACDLMVIVGTSLNVYPAAELPALAKKAGATIIEVNLEPTHMTSWLVDFFLQGPAEMVLPELVKHVNQTV